jgi:uncharacterized protein (TIGR00369 family)
MTDNNHQNRQRSFTWSDPQPIIAAAETLDGLSVLQAIANGALPPPPIGDLMNFRLTEVEKGRAVFAGEPAEYHYNPTGAVHGGLAATLIDSATACAVYSVLAAGVFYTTIELHVNYVRPITVHTGRLRCIGQVIHSGRRQATAEARLLDENDKLYAHGTATCIIMSG